MKSTVFFLAFLISLSNYSFAGKDDLVVIAHRGASGYLPEHTLEGAAMAHAWGVDYIEPDIVMTKDNQLVILHDPHLDTTTNVRRIYPNRARKDGRYYAIDFTLKEIKNLQVHERKDHDTGKAVFPKRFPLNKSKFTVPTLQEFIELVQGLNKSTGKKIGIYPELKNPEFHTKAGKDIASATIKVLRKYGYENNGQAIIQCFFPPTLKRLKNEFKTKIPLVLLIADNSWNESSIDYNTILTEKGIKEVSTYASGIGPWIPQILKKKRKSYKITKLVSWAHKYGLKVHTYTHRSDSLPSFAKNDGQLFNILINKVGVDGIFSDFADKVISYKRK